MDEKPARPRLSRGWRVLVRLLNVALALALSEGVVRLVGARPKKPPVVVHSNEPTMMQPDPLLGWRPRPGAYEYPGYTRGAPNVRMTIWPDGSRAVAPVEVAGPARVLLVGDSFMQGWAVSDDETFAWRLQARWPAVAFRNFGAGGYGTLQSLVVLEELLARPGPPPKLVLYDLIDHHGQRNVADFLWLKALADASGRGMVSVPYALLGRDGALERYPPAPFLEWPLRETLASVASLEDFYMRLKTRGRAAQQRPVTDALLRQMSTLCREHGTTLLVVLLGNSPESHAHHGTFFAAEHIRFADCDRPVQLSLIVPGEGHPNGKLHAMWADCIAEAIRGDLE